MLARRGEMSVEMSVGEGRGGEMSVGCLGFRL